MSAIAGLFRLDGRAAARIELEAMGDALQFHGSESSGTWLDGPVGLTHRLWRTTPEDAVDRQPLAGPEGRFVVVCDARIDNRPELAARLDISANEARELPDSAFVARAYDKWGEACAAQLIGDYAFAIWDARRRRLFAARDHFGNVPLSYYRTADLFAFASMPKGLFALPEVPREINEEKIADFLVSNHFVHDSTFYRGISHLPPAHALTVDRDGLRLRRCWAPDLGRRIRFPRDEDYLEAFRELFDRVIRDHRRSTTPVGVMLSGGLDSSAVAATAARQLHGEGARLATFTEVPCPEFAGASVPGWYPDERPFVEAIGAMHDNLDPQFVSSAGRTFLDDVDGMHRHLEVPFRNPSNRVWMEAILEAGRARGLRVMLTGGSGNVTMSWTGLSALPRLLKTGHWLALWRQARGLARAGRARSPWRALLGHALWPILPVPLLQVAERLRRPPGSAWQSDGPIDPRFAEAMHVEARWRDAGFDRAHRRRVGRTTPHLLIPGFDYVGEIRAGWLARYGIDFRDPASDRRLIEFCLALPLEQFVRDGQTRLLLRRAMRDRVPESVSWNPRRGLQAADWFISMNRAKPGIERTVAALAESPVASRALDVPRMQRLVHDWPESTAWTTLETRDRYHNVLEHGLAVGLFILWVEGSQRPETLTSRRTGC